MQNRLVQHADRPSRKCRCCRCAKNLLQPSPKPTASEATSDYTPAPQSITIGRRLSTEVERLRGVNAELTANLAEAKAKSLEAELHLQAALKSKEIDASAATAREEVLRAEAEQARTRTDTMSQSLAEVCVGFRENSGSFGGKARVMRLFRPIRFRVACRTFWSPPHVQYKPTRPSKERLFLVVHSEHYFQAIREQSGLLTETANAKVAAEVHEAKSRTAEVEVRTRLTLLVLRDVGGWSDLGGFFDVIKLSPTPVHVWGADNTWPTTPLQSVQSSTGVSLPIFKRCRYVYVPRWRA